MNPYKVDDVLASSWGYDQTNVEFFKVTAVKGSMIEMRQLNAVTVENSPGAMSGKTWPVAPFEFHPDFPEVFRKRPSADGVVKLASYRRCYRWDGKPKSCSWYG